MCSSQPTGAKLCPAIPLPTQKRVFQTLRATRAPAWFPGRTQTKAQATAPALKCDRPLQPISHVHGLEVMGLGSRYSQGLMASSGCKSVGHVQPLLSWALCSQASYSTFMTQRCDCDFVWFLGNQFLAGSLKSLALNTERETPPPQWPSAIDCPPGSALQPPDLNTGTRIPLLISKIPISGGGFRTSVFLAIARWV
jgi:hypothetical protein